MGRVNSGPNSNDNDYGEDGPYETPRLYGAAALLRKPAADPHQGLAEKSQFEGNSTTADATFNFLSSIIGAGVIGYGSAIAQGGGLVSLAAVCLFAAMSKQAYDLVIELSVVDAGEGAKGSFENLAHVCYPGWGRKAVEVAKSLFIFGCLVVFIVIFKDNFAPATYHLIYGDNQDASGLLADLLRSAYWTTFLVSTLVVLPLSLLRDVTPLSRFAAFKLGIFIYITFVVLVMFFKISGGEDHWSHFTDRQKLFKDWLVVHRGIAGSLGTFLFSFVAQHTVHICYQSLKPELRDMEHWRMVSLSATALGTVLSLLSKCIRHGRQ